DRSPLGEVGEQQAGEVLPADGGRSSQVGRGGGELEAAGQGDDGGVAGEAAGGLSGVASSCGLDAIGNPPPRPVTVAGAAATRGDRSGDGRRVPSPHRSASGSTPATGPRARRGGEAG